jgi:broad specificity phosphatase PhoE
VNKYLILVKHSLPEIVENIPAREWHLSEDGQVRAMRLADRLLAYDPEILISSVESKAKETSEIISKVHNLDVQIVENLHEHDRSQISYLSRHEFQTAVYTFFLTPDKLVFGNETANEAYSRFSKAVHSIIEIHKNKTAVLVSHGTVISLFVSHLIGISAFPLWDEMGLPGFVVLDVHLNKLIAQENIL